MTKMRFLLVALLATVAWTGAANGAFYFDIWPTTADGSMDLHPSEGYAIAGEGNIRLAKTYQHMTFLGFDGRSDGPDGIPQDRSRDGVNDSDDGVYLTDWLAGLKVVRAALYFRDSSWNTCDHTGQGYWLNDPIQIVGFRVGNAGDFVDRGDLGNGFGGCCAGYAAPLLEGGENAPPAWRIGPPPYSQRGDIAGGEYYKLSNAAAENAGQEVHADQAWFDSHNGFGGYSDTSNRFAFGWIVMNAATTGQMINSKPIEWTDCTGAYGELEPRDFGADGTGAEGWYGTSVDRAIVEAMGNPNGAVKGLVLDATDAPIIYPGEQLWNNLIWTRDQSGGYYGPYLTVTATLAGDINNDGTVNVMDLLRLANAWLSREGDPNWDAGADLRQDGQINVMDLLALANDWLKTIPAQ